MSRWDWLGLTERRWHKAPDEEIRPAKTAWDWLQFAIVPIALVVVALAFNASQARRDAASTTERTRQDRAIALDARRDATLEAYLNRMSGLILDRDLLRTPASSDARVVARTLTLTTLRRLDAARKAELVLFLEEARLITNHGPSRTKEPRDPVCRPPGCIVRDPPIAGYYDSVVSLDGADLRGLPLSHQYVMSANLSGADLRHADFDGTGLYDVNLSGADLRGASFRSAHIRAGDLTDARLDGADFDHAAFRGSEIRRHAHPLRRTIIRSSLSFSCLTDTHFTGADLEFVNLRWAMGFRTDFRRARLIGVGRTQDAAIMGAQVDGALGAPARWQQPPVGTPCLNSAP
jgi:hypothetical protein